ncbi:MAG: aminotransferase class V-fold PLP-dependent enzyme, partial [Candidatus Altiarchaeales archaeon]|nr:aminotransferase class V-fold PLP-dependent enzyme [Candidatus Altiarchaeales archaeon]
ACEAAEPEHNTHMRKLRDKLIQKIKQLPDTTLNGHLTERLCNNANIGFGKIEGESLLLRLSDLGVMVSTGSACSSHSLKSSHVLRAIGVEDHRIHGAIRFSLSRYTTFDEINYAVECVEKTVEELRKISPLT